MDRIDDEYSEKLRQLQDRYAALGMEIPDEEYENLRSNWIMEEVQRKSLILTNPLF